MRRTPDFHTHLYSTLHSTSFCRTGTRFAYWQSEVEMRVVNQHAEATLLEWGRYVDTMAVFRKSGACMKRWLRHWTCGVVNGGHELTVPTPIQDYQRCLPAATRHGRTIDRRDDSAVRYEALGGRRSAADRSGIRGRTFGGESVRPTPIHAGLSRATVRRRWNHRSALTTQFRRTERRQMIPIGSTSP